jgi:hypothetical protein
LIRLVRQRIQAKVADQVPQLESLNGDEALSNFFLGLTPSPLVEFSIANYTIKRHWQIDSGGLHSVSLGDRYALFPTTASAADLADSSRAIATGRVATLLPAAATLLIDNPAALKTTEAYKAVLTLRASTIGVAFQGEPKGILALRAAMATATLIHEDLNPRFIVVCENSTFTIIAGSRTVFGPHTQTPENARAFVILLEHMAKWLFNSPSSSPTILSSNALPSPSSTLPISATHSDNPNRRPSAPASPTIPRSSFTSRFSSSPNPGVFPPGSLPAGPRSWGPANPSIRSPGDPSTLPSKIPMPIKRRMNSS